MGAYPSVPAALDLASLPGYWLGWALPSSFPPHPSQPTRPPHRRRSRQLPLSWTKHGFRAVLSLSQKPSLGLFDKRLHRQIACQLQERRRGCRCSSCFSYQVARRLPDMRHRHRGPNPFRSDLFADPSTRHRSPPLEPLRTQPASHSFARRAPVAAPIRSKSPRRRVPTPSTRAPPRPLQTTTLQAAPPSQARAAFQALSHSRPTYISSSSSRTSPALALHPLESVVGPDGNVSRPTSTPASFYTTSTDVSSPAGARRRI